MELCLGTVQFGLDYGIIGQKKPPLEYAVNCLDYATQNGIAAIDTAAAYGNAEEVVGAFLKKKTVAAPRAVSRAVSPVPPAAQSSACVIDSFLSREFGSDILYSCQR